jgi:hypothetical protein
MAPGGDGGMGTGEQLANTSHRDGEMTRDVESTSVHHVPHSLEHKFRLINGPMEWKEK